jgi:hypothetical protein
MLGHGAHQMTLASYSMRSGGVVGEWQPLLVADSGFLGQLCFICQLVHHCVNASLLL